VKSKYALLLLFGIIACQSQKPEKVEMETNWQKFSYLLGRDISQDLMVRYPDIELESLFKGIESGYAGEQNAINDRETNKIRRFAMEEMFKRQVKPAAETDSVFEARLKENLDKSEAFLKKNGARKGVITIKSGLQYEIIKKGNGEAPRPADEVRLKYSGMTYDGIEFDNSRKFSNETAVLRVQHLIKGWQEALLLMKAGAKWKLFIPSELAYGRYGRNPNIKPNTALVFEVELLDVIKNKYGYSRDKK